MSRLLLQAASVIESVDVLLPLSYVSDGFGEGQKSWEEGPRSFRTEGQLQSEGDSID